MANGNDDKEITEIALAIMLLEEELLVEMDEALKTAGLWRDDRKESVRALIRLVLGAKDKR
jgi:hypothetical protein|tara:strand:+ start:1184 stop:1366 length:183 start_codon:yes stop_codon:yes gene_type:complete